MDLGLDGRLLRFSASSARTQSQQPPDWSRYFEAARLEMAQFQPAPPAVDQAGVSAAWTGIYPGAGEFPVRIEANASGQATSFAVLFPWNGTDAGAQPLVRPLVFGGLWWLGILAAVAVIARRNWIAGRVDRSGAWQLAVLACVASVLGSQLIAWNLERFYRFLLEYGLYLSIALGVQVATFYIALEPWARRFWPETLVTWSRVVAGRWRDPLVGRDVLIALVGAVLMSCAHRVLYLWITNTGGAPAGVAFAPNPDSVAGGFGFSLLNLMGARHSSGGMLLSLIVGISNSLSLFFVVFFFRVLIRRPVLSAVAAIAFLTLANWGINSGLTWDGWFSVAVVSVLALASTRYGFFTLVVWTWFGQFGEHAMLTPNFGEWYGQSSLMVVVVMTATALWAFHTALGGQPLFASSRLAARTM
jgi:hypothetical protein